MSCSLAAVVVSRSSLSRTAETDAPSSCLCVYRSVRFRKWLGASPFRSIASGHDVRERNRQQNRLTSLLLTGFAVPFIFLLSFSLDVPIKTTRVEISLAWHARSLHHHRSPSDANGQSTLYLMCGDFSFSPSSSSPRSDSGVNAIKIRQREHISQFLSPMFSSNVYFRCPSGSQRLL